uniref:Cadherin domain-containing protein n=1 Tax=Seriola lalandi dorsalis TaxID=1841481 RepID=A0A3B4YJ39_SERLL
MWLPYSNDNPPEFDPPDYFTPVTKSVKVGTKLIRVVVEYVITSGNSSSKFKLDKTSGWITVASSLTSDMKKIFLIGITASDKGNPPLSSRTSVRIAVTEENHHTPEFSQSQISATVPESLAVGTAIRTLSARDKDKEMNGLITYNITSGNDKGLFALNSKTGVLSLAQSLDFEEKHYVSVTVHVTDVNDNPPVFDPDEFFPIVSEGLSPGGLVTFVSAEDSDSVPSWSRFSYSIAPEFDKNVFTINPKTGQVSVAAELDRETTPVYNLTVLAVDTGTPPATGSATVIVNLEDINDNGPTLTTAYAEVMENQRAGTAVTTLTASDPDLPPNQGPFLYSLLSSGSANSYFSLSPAGVLTTSREIDREQISDFYLSVFLSCEVMKGLHDLACGESELCSPRGFFLCCLPPHPF